MLSKKFWRIALSIVLCFAVTATYGVAGLGGLPDGSPSSATGVAKEEAASKLTAVKNDEFKKNTAEKKYREGEAIVVMKPNSAEGGGTLRGTSDLEKRLPDGVSVEGTLSFGDSASSESGASEKSMSLLRAAGGGGEGGFNISKVTSNALSTKDLVEKLKKSGEVLIAEPNIIVKAEGLTNDKYSDFQWGLDNIGQQGGTTGSDISIKTAWGKTQGKTTNDAIVAIIDSGVDYMHEDLEDNIWENPYPKTKLKGTHGYDFVNYDDNPADDLGHGTHVAGIIGAEGDNGVGISGVNREVKIMALKFLDAEGYGDVFGALEAYEYIYKAQGLGANIVAVNNSWSGEGESKIFDEVITRVGDGGCVTVCAAGNGGASNDDYPQIPANSESRYAIAVAASNENGEPASFTNYGSKTVELAAPGTDILSSVSKPVYNPTLYPTDTSINEAFDAFNDLSSNVTAAAYDSDNEKWETDFITVTNGAYFGTGSAANNKSLLLSIPNAVPGRGYNIVIPYTSIGTSASIYTSMMARMATGPASDNPLEYGGILALSNAKLNAGGSLPEQYRNPYYELASVIDLSTTDEPENYWTHLYGVAQAKPTAGNQAIVITYIPNVEGEHQVYIDDFGLSLPTSEENESKFGKYDFWSGTSMSTPFVAGAIAQIAAIHENYTALHIAQMLPYLVQESSSSKWDNKLAGGVFNLVDVSAKRPFIKDVTIKGAEVVLNGYGFGAAGEGGTVKVDGAEKTANFWTNSSIRISATGIVNKLAGFEVSAGGLSAKLDEYVVKGKAKATEAKNLLMNGYYGGGFVADGNGKYMYYVNALGMVMKGDPAAPLIDYSDYDEDENDAYVEYAEPWTALSSVAEKDYAAFFPDSTKHEREGGTFYLTTKPVNVANKLYFGATLDASATASHALLRYDLATNKFSRAGDMPGAELKAAQVDKNFSSVIMSTLGSYNGKIYLIGGYDITSKEAVKHVKVFDPAKSTWTAGPAIPEPRFAATALQVGNSLTLSLGGNGDVNAPVTTPSTLVYDGSRWSGGGELPTTLNISIYSEITDKNDDGAEKIEDPYFGIDMYIREIPYVEGAVGIISGGLVISGVATDGYGDTFAYNIANKTYTASNYQLKEKPSGYAADGIALGGKMYVVAPDYDDYVYDEEYYSEGSEDSGSVSVYSLPITSGLLRVTGTVNSAAYGSISGAGDYTPGTLVRVTAAVKKGTYFVKNGLSIDGKAVTTQTTAFYISKNTAARATFKKYATKVKISPSKLTLKKGKSKKLKVSVSKLATDKFGYTAANKGVIWKSSNTKYATVSSNGTVKAKVAGKKVTITATARDGSGAQAKITIKIKKK